jgi:uncharacterized protein YjiS (DUF1127 family)
MTTGRWAGIERIGSLQSTSRRRATPTIVETIELWLERRRQRRGLLALSDHMLKDVGISRADAVGEASKPFWRP